MPFNRGVSRRHQPRCTPKPGRASGSLAAPPPKRPPLLPVPPASEVKLPHKLATMHLTAGHAGSLAAPAPKAHSCLMCTLGGRASVKNSPSHTAFTQEDC
eukprot:165646-Chlamydomonas_euryale.AAC.9